jgi:hypothetical protein
MGHHKNLEITKESEFTPEQEKTMTEEVREYPRIEELNILWDVAYKAMHESANLGTEKGVEEAKQIRDAIWDAQWAVRRAASAERKDAREADLKHRSELIKLMAKG